MRVIEGIAGIRRCVLRNPVVTIGNFDGVHRGHQRLIETVKRRAEELDGDSVVVTFHPHPVKVLCPTYPLHFITPHREKLEVLSHLGVDVTVVIPFSHEFASLSASAFVEQYLVEGLGIRWLVVGYDYHFGKGREGNIELLRSYGTQRGFGVDTVSEVSVEGFVVSSTAIRKIIQEGRVSFAGKLLGRLYAVTGPVLRGRDRGGKMLGFPTANVDGGDHVMPKEGVYAVWVALDGRLYRGAANIGHNPTFGNTELSLEVHILDFTGNLYGREITVYFVQYVREEKKFSGIEALIAQIHRDVETVREMLREPPSSPLL